VCDKAEFVPIIVAALTSSNVGIENVGCLLLWSMLETSSGPSVSAKLGKKQTNKKEFLLKQEGAIIAKKDVAHSKFIESLKDNELCEVLYDVLEAKADSEDDISVLCKCILWAMKGIDFSG